MDDPLPAKNDRSIREFHEALGSFLAEMRKRRKKTQCDFSIPQRTIRRIEKGDIHRASALEFFREMKPCNREVLKWMRLIMELLSPECNRCDPDCQMCDRDFQDFATELKSQANLSEYIMERVMLKNVIELNPYGIAIFNETGHFVKANQAYIDLFKQPPPPFITIFDSPPLKKAGVQEEFFKLKEGKTIHLGPMWHNSRDVGEEWPDNPICLHAVAFPIIDPEKNIRNYVIMFEDITKMVHAEDQLKKALQFKSDFMATVSHELRTPLSGIIGSASLILHDQTLTLPERRKMNIQDILGNADRLVLMINNILDIARIDAGNTRIVAEYFSIGDAIHSSIESFQGLAKEKELSVTAHIDKKIPILFNDKHKIGYIITNLVGNALKFTDKGQIVISAKLHDQDHSRIVISVCDTGIGIPQDKMQAIFEHFKQLDASPTRRHNGIGMGLALVRAYTDMLCGEIRVESEVGKGSTFTVTLPIAAMENSGV